MKTPAVVGFYGKSDAGKTLLITKLIYRLTNGGYKVATIKITDKEVSLDGRGKDTWRHSQAGAELVALSSPIETSYIVRERRDERRIIWDIAKLGQYDVILVEGARDPSIPKIQIGDAERRDNTVGIYKDNFEEIIEIIKREITKIKQSANDKTIIIRVNGKTIPLGDFPSVFIKNTIVGMLRSLKGVDRVDKVEIFFEY